MRYYPVSIPNELRDKLRACPFCGHHGCLSDLALMDGPISRGWPKLSVFCGSCDTFAPGIAIDREHIEMAIALWNGAKADEDRELIEVEINSEKRTMTRREYRSHLQDEMYEKVYSAKVVEAPTPDGQPAAGGT